MFSCFSKSLFFVCALISDLYKEFIDDEFDAKSYANTVIESHIIGDALAKLSTGIDLLNQELHKQVILFCFVFLCFMTYSN